MKNLVYHDFILFTDDIEIDMHKRVKSFTVRVFKSPAGEGEKKELVTLANLPDLPILGRKLGDREFDDTLEQQILYGTHLAKLLLPPYARSMFHKSLAELGNDEGLRFRLRLDNELTDLHWEYMYLPELSTSKQTAKGFLALDHRISIVRHEALAIPPGKDRSTDKRRIIVAMATPQPYIDYPKLTDLPIEQAHIEKMLDSIKGVDAVYIPHYTGDYAEVIPGAQIKDLEKALTTTTDIFHFSGHGEFVKEVGPGGMSTIGHGSIILADDNNHAVAVSAKSFMSLMQGCGIRLVILGACETGMHDKFNAWNSIAASLLRGAIPVVIAMQFTIFTDLATLFMEALYQSLVAGQTIDQAVALGRVAIRKKALDEDRCTRDWGVPVLYLRTDDDSVFSPVTDQAARHDAEKFVEALFLVQRALQYLDSEDFKNALKFLRKASELDPRYKETYEKLKDAPTNRPEKPPKKSSPLKLRSQMLIATVIIGSIIILGSVTGILPISPRAPYDPNLLLPSLTVVVRDDQTGQLLIGADVFLDDTHWGTTDANGQCSIMDVPQGNYTVWAQMEGYYETAQAVEIPRDTQINLPLTPIRISLGCLESPSGVVSWWPGDDTSMDILRLNPGTLVNGASFTRGMVDQAFQFDGANDAMWAPGKNIDDLQHLTIEAWVLLNSMPNFTIQRFVTLGNEKAVLRYDGLGGTPNLHFYMNVGRELHHIFVSNVLDTSVFHHIVGTYDGREMRLYLDGEIVGNYYVTGLVAVGDGVILSSEEEPLDGLIDEVTIYNRALSMFEIQAIYQASESGKCIPIVPRPSYTLEVIVLFRNENMDIPLSPASVSLDGVFQGFTDRQGVLVISDVLEGVHTVYVELEDFFPGHRRVEVYEDMRENIYLILIPMLILQ